MVAPLSREPATGAQSDSATMSCDGVSPKRVAPLLARRALYRAINRLVR
jgi:hypothetical protein